MFMCDRCFTTTVYLYLCILHTLWIWLLLSLCTTTITFHTLDIMHKAPLFPLRCVSVRIDKVLSYLISLISDVSLFCLQDASRLLPPSSADSTRLSRSNSSVSPVTSSPVETVSSWLTWTTGTQAPPTQRLPFFHINLALYVWCVFWTVIHHHSVSDVSESTRNLELISFKKSFLSVFCPVCLFVTQHQWFFEFKEFEMKMKWKIRYPLVCLLLLFPLLLFLSGISLLPKRWVAWRSSWRSGYSQSEHTETQWGRVCWTWRPGTVCDRKVTVIAQRDSRADRRVGVSIDSNLSFSTSRQLKQHFIVSNKETELEVSCPDEI